MDLSITSHIKPSPELAIRVHSEGRNLELKAT